MDKHYLASASKPGVYLLVCLFLGFAFILFSTFFYPGGTHNDPESVGFSWRYNYLSNLFSEKAINGADNPARLWASIGMVLLCTGYALFFIAFAQRIPSKSSKNVIRYCGASAMVLTAFAVTPLHDTVLPLAITLSLLSLFYITVHLFIMRLHFYKTIAIFILILMYLGNFIYYSGIYLDFLPVIQKTTLVTVSGWMLGLTYGTNATSGK